MIKQAKNSIKHSPVFKKMIGYLVGRFEMLPDKRTGNNSFIQMKDVGLSAFSIFFTQCQSFLAQQRLMARQKKGQSNASSLFNIEHVPCDNHIRQLLDPVPPSEVFPVFDQVLSQIKAADLLDNYRCHELDKQIFIALDGVQYYSSQKIDCVQCNHRMHRNGTTTYFHAMVSATIVAPGNPFVLPLCPEFIEPQDGHTKQDCENTATKRWLAVHGKSYANLNATLLGDDLFSCQPVCEDTLAAGLHFIYTCKTDSHKCLYRSVDPLKKDGGITEVELRVTEKKKRYRYVCRYVNQVPIRDSNDALQVNWCEVEVFDQTNKRVYQGAFITDHNIDDDNVLAICRAGRTRWKTENEHNNTLKNQGYCLEHNFGHGNEHLSSLLATLILLSFLFHTILHLLDARYRAIRGMMPRYEFFQQLRTLLLYMYFSSWGALMECMYQACELNDTS